MLEVNGHLHNQIRMAGNMPVYACAKGHRNHTQERQSQINNASYPAVYCNHRELQGSPGNKMACS
jgi:hypothetical protein